jgi:hypothetical protein
MINKKETIKDERQHTNPRVIRTELPNMVRKLLLPVKNGLDLGLNPEISILLTNPEIKHEVESAKDGTINIILLITSGMPAASLPITLLIMEIV